MDSREKIFFLGDVYLPNEYDVGINEDNIVFNLEHPITDWKRGYPNKVNLKSEAENITSTFGRKVLAVNLANNHIFDYNEEGVNDTLLHLENKGIRAFGAGSKENNNNNPATVTVGDNTVGMLGYISPKRINSSYPTNQEYIATANLERIKKDIAMLNRVSVDRIVVQIHWGTEDVHFPNAEQIKLGHNIAQLDVDLIIGHHSHCIQPWETYNGTPIFYGLGNCIMPPISSLSYYDENGKPTKQFEKPQHWWNKKSIGIAYFPRSDNIEIISLYFDGVLQLKTKHKIDYFRSYVFNMFSYSQIKRIYNVSRMYGILRKEFMNYIEEPTIITPRKIKELLYRIRDYEK